MTYKKRNLAALLNSYCHSFRDDKGISPICVCLILRLREICRIPFLATSQDNANFFTILHILNTIAVQSQAYV